MPSFAAESVDQLQDDLFDGVDRWAEWAEWAWGVLQSAELTRTDTAGGYTRVLGRLLVLRVMLDRYPLFRGWVNQTDPLKAESAAVNALAWATIEQEWPVVVEALRSYLDDDMLLNTLLFYATMPTVVRCDDGAIDYAPYYDRPLVGTINDYWWSTDAQILASGEGRKGWEWIAAGMPLRQTGPSST